MSRRMPGWALALAATAFAATADAQAMAPDAGSAAPYGPPVMDTLSYSHLLVDQFEGRLGGGTDAFRWSGEAWTGTDSDRLWLKSEGLDQAGKVEDGSLEAFYDRPVTSFWDLQAGARADLDSGPGRIWAALGVEGMGAWYSKVSATAYVGQGGRLAARVSFADDLRLTQRLVLEPEIEADLYSRDDPARRIGSGLSSFDSGLRLRYEITRKFAPYVGVSWEEKLGRTASFNRADGEAASAVRTVVGVRAWF
jgi:copper resistance protein B